MHSDRNIMIFKSNNQRYIASGSSDRKKGEYEAFGSMGRKSDKSEIRKQERAETYVRWNKIRMSKES